LQAFFMSLFDMLGWFASAWARQSFICCCLSDLLVPVLDDCVVVLDELLLFGYVWRSDGDVVVCAATTPAASNAATAKGPVTDFNMGSSVRLPEKAAWTGHPCGKNVARASYLRRTATYVGGGRQAGKRADGQDRYPLNAR
jgi:hypothetical protein